MSDVLRSVFSVPRSRLGGNRFRVLDIVVLASAILLVAQAPLSVATAAWVPNLEPLPRVAIVGLLVGYLIELHDCPAAEFDVVQRGEHGFDVALAAAQLHEAIIARWPAVIAFNRPGSCARHACPTRPTRPARPA